MYGTALSNKQIQILIDGPSAFKITPYSAGHQKLKHYKLSPARILKPGPLRRDGTRRHQEVGDLQEGPHVFQPREYLKVEVAETIFLPEGIVGEFTLASALVDQGFDLVAGKLDSEYGTQGERIILGLINLLDEPNPFDPNRGIAHVSFTDFRGTEREYAHFSTTERAAFSDRRIE